MLKFYTYPKCSTCQKAKKWLEENGVAFEEIHIVENNPSVEEIKSLHEISGLPVQKFFNTSGMKYRELGLSKVVKEKSDAELYEILATDGMLVKRPIVTDGKSVTLGFKIPAFEQSWQK